jgi:hypothetical protein
MSQSRRLSKFHHLFVSMQAAILGQLKTGSLEEPRPVTSGIVCLARDKKSSWRASRDNLPDEDRTHVLDG